MSDCVICGARACWTTPSGLCARCEDRSIEERHADTSGRPSHWAASCPDIQPHHRADGRIVRKAIREE